MKALVVAGFLFACVSPALAAAPPGNPPATVADGKAAHLDALFAELKSAPTEAEGKTVEHEIVAEWLKSGDAETDAMMLKAIAAMETGTLNQALALLDKVIARSPDYAEGWNKRATVYYYIDAYDKSLADIKKTLELEPRHFGALSGLGMIMIELGDKRRALAAFQRAYEVDPVINNGKAVIEQLQDALSKPL